MEDINDAAYEIVLYVFTTTLMTMRKFLFNEYNDANYQLSNYKDKIIMLIAININSSLMSFIDPTRDCFDTRIPFLLSMVNHKSPICLLHMIKEIIIRKFIPENNPIIEIDEEKKKNMSVIINEERHVIHPKLKNFDTLVSVGVLGYIQDPHKVIAALGKRVKSGGKVYFVDYTNLLKIMPEQKWLHDVDGIKRMFAQGGFKVNVSRRKGLLWNTIHIYGKKV